MHDFVRALRIFFLAFLFSMYNILSIFYTYGCVTHTPSKSTILLFFFFLHCRVLLVKCAIRRMNPKKIECIDGSIYIVRYIHQRYGIHGSKKWIMIYKPTKEKRSENWFLLLYLFYDRTLKISTRNAIGNEMKRKSLSKCEFFFSLYVCVYSWIRACVYV